MTNPFRLSWEQFEKENPQVELSATPDEFEPSLYERFVINMDQAYAETLHGAGRAAGSAAARRNQERVQDRYERMRGYDTPMEALVAFGGAVLGSAMTPETFLGAGAGRILGGTVREGLTAAGKIAGVGAVTNAGADAVVQAARVDMGMEDSFSWKQNLLSATLGAAIPVTLTAGMDATGLLFKKRARDVAEIDAASDPTGDVAPLPDWVQVVDELEPSDITVRPRGPVEPEQIPGSADTLAADQVVPNLPRTEVHVVRPVNEAPTLQPRAATVASPAAVDVPTLQPIQPEAQRPAARDVEPPTEAPAPRLEPIPDLDTAPPVTRQQPMEPGPYRVAARQLQIDAARFQFKDSINERGETGLLSNVDRWDPDAAGQILVWQDRRGGLFVADGHQRVNLAQRLMDSGAERDIQIPARVYREMDGITSDRMRAIAAIKNIREGSGSPMDAARILRDWPEMRGEIEKLSDARRQNAANLAKLDDGSFMMVVNGVVAPEYGAIVGRLIPDDPEKQVAAISALAKFDPNTLAEANIIVRRVANSGLTEGGERSQGSLFGDEPPESTAVQEIRILGRAGSELMRDKRTMERVNREADRIESTGSRLERDRIRAAADEADRTAAYIQSFADTKGPIRDALIREADRLARGSTSLAGATRAFIDDVRQYMESLDARGDGGGGSGGRAEASRPNAPDGDSSGSLFLTRERAQARRLAQGPDALRPAAGVATPITTPDTVAPRLKEAVEALQRLTNTPLRPGRMPPGVDGLYNKTSGVARARFTEDLVTVSHEIAHAFHVGQGKKREAEINNLIRTAPDVLNHDAMRALDRPADPVEAFAEYMSAFIMNPAWARRVSPQFDQEFRVYLNTLEPEIAQQIAEVQSLIRDYQTAPSRGVIRSDMVSSARPTLGKRIMRFVRPEKDPAGNTLFSIWDRAYTAVVDDKHPVLAAVRGLSKIYERNFGTPLNIKYADDPYVLSRLSTNAYNGAHLDLKEGVRPYREVEPVGPSLTEALELAVGKTWFGRWDTEEMSDFGAYLISRRATDEWDRYIAGELKNAPDKFTKGDHDQNISELEAMYPNFRAAADLVYEWQRNFLRKKMMAGFLSPDLYNRLIMEKPTYVPFQRDMSDKLADAVAKAGPGNSTLRQSMIQAFRGSTRSVINPIESIVYNAYNTHMLMARNEVVRTLDSLATKAGPNGGAIAERIPDKELRGTKVDAIEALRAAGKGAGVDDADLDDMLLAAADLLDDQTLTTLYRASDINEKGEPIVYFWEGGERKALRLADGRLGQELMKSITNLGQETAGWVLNSLAAPSIVLRAGITTSPEFVVANLFRDQVAAWILNRKFVPFVSAAQGAMDPRMARLHAYGGGIMGGENVAALDQSYFNRNVGALRRTPLRFLRDPREFLRLTEVTETMTRVGLFKQYFETGKKYGLSEYEAMIEGAYRAMDYTDFGRHGSKMLALRKVVTFLNVAIQGLDRSGRVLFKDLLVPATKALRGEALSASEREQLTDSFYALGKVSVITGASLALWALNQDDPEYQEVNDYFRATHWPVKIFGEWVMIPKPFELAIPANFAERLAEGVMQEDPTWAERFRKSLGETLIPPTDAPAIKVPYELMFNYDSFRDRAIVPDWMQGYEPWMQFNAHTSEFGKAVGKLLGVSPMKVDHAITGFTGSWGRNLLAISDAAVSETDRAGLDATTAPFIRRFVKDPIRGGRGGEDFYNLVGRTTGRLMQKATTYDVIMDSGDADRAAAFLNTMKEDERIWTTLTQGRDVVKDRPAFSADNKRLHPLYRASDIASITSSIRRDISSDKLDVPSTEGAMARDTLARIQAAEVRNAMILVGADGWAGKKPVDVSPLMADLRAASPTLADEYDARLAQKRVMPYNGVASVWPEVRQRLLRDGVNADLDSLRGAALAQ